MTRPLGLYIHIPWCVTRCIYCDFNTYIDGEEGLKAHYHAALQREIREAGAALGHPPLDTLFFGGGTPTTVPAAWLGEIVATVRDHFQVRPDAEITSEANPGTLSVDYLRALRDGGINRLSLGVQSFVDDELRFLSRLHDSDRARQAVAMARAAGFDNLNLDLIFNLPYQSLPAWQRNIREALALAPEHLSLYSLIVEPGTPLHRQVTRGEIAPPDDDLAADMYEWTMGAMAEGGFAQYEISNWARAEAGAADWQTPRRAAAHNLLYWRYDEWLGVGAGAHSTQGGKRWANVKRPQSYIERVEGGAGLAPARDPKLDETISPAWAMVEQMMMGLRLTREGVSEATFAARHGLPLAEPFAEAIARGEARGLLEWVQTATERRLRLTPPGRLLANQAIIEFFPTDE